MPPRHGSARPRLTAFPSIAHGVARCCRSRTGSIFSDVSSFGAAGAGFTMPLFNAQALGFQQDAVEAQAKESLAEYEQTVLIAFREVEDALVAARTAREQNDAQQQQVNALQSALRLAELRYKGGLANYLDVLVARRNLFEAELAMTGSRRLHLVSVVNCTRRWAADGLPRWSRAGKERQLTQWKSRRHRSTRSNPSSHAGGAACIRGTAGGAGEAEKPVRGGALGSVFKQ